MQQGWEGPRRCGVIRNDRAFGSTGAGSPSDIEAEPDDPFRRQMEIQLSSAHLNSLIVTRPEQGSIVWPQAMLPQRNIRHNRNSSLQGADPRLQISFLAHAFRDFSSFPNRSSHAWHRPPVLCFGIGVRVESNVALLVAVSGLKMVEGVISAMRCRRCRQCTSRRATRAGADRQPSKSTSPRPTVRAAGGSFILRRFTNRESSFILPLGSKHRNWRTIAMGARLWSLSRRRPMNSHFSRHGKQPRGKTRRRPHRR